MADPTYQELVTRLRNERTAHDLCKKASQATTEAWNSDRDAAFKVVEVYKDPDTMLAYLRGDPSKLHEAIMNLEAVLGPR